VCPEKFRLLSPAWAGTPKKFGALMASGLVPSGLAGRALHAGIFLPIVEKHPPLVTAPPPNPPFCFSPRFCEVVG